MFPLETVWSLPLNSALTAAPAFDDRRGFFPIEGNRLVAYDLLTGKQLWIAKIGTTVEPSAGGDLVFVVTPDSVVALHATDGSAAWQFPFAEPLAVPPVWDTGWLMVALQSGALVAINSEDGHVVWQVTLTTPASARPALAGNHVYVPGADGRVFALSVHDGKPLWEHKLGGAATDILPLDDRLFVGSKDNYLYCLRTHDGSFDWRWRTGGDVEGVPVLDERTVYFVALDNVLRALNRNNGVQRWKRALPFRPTSGPLKATDTLIVSGLTPSLRGFATKDGAAAGEFALPAELAAPPHLLAIPRTPFPTIIVCTQDVAKGATVSALTRSIEPAMAPVAPLPNVSPVPATLPSTTPLTP